MKMSSHTLIWEKYPYGTENEYLTQSDWCDLFSAKGYKFWMLELPDYLSNRKGAVVPD